MVSSKIGGTQRAGGGLGRAWGGDRCAVRGKEYIAVGDQKLNESDSCFRIQMHSVRLEIRWWSNKRSHKLQLWIVHAGDLVIQERREAWKISQVPIRL